MSKKSKLLWSELNSTHAVFGFAIAVVFVYVFLMLPALNSGRFFYWFYVDCDGCLVDAIVDFIPVIVLGIVLLWIFKCVREGQRFSCLIFWFICPLLYISLGALPLPASHLDEVYVEDELWRLAYLHSSSDGVYYGVFQCDSLGINCEEVHLINTDQLRDQSTPELIVDSQQRSIMVRNSGGDLYRHEF